MWRVSLTLFAIICFYLGNAVARIPELVAEKMYDNFVGKCPPLTTHSVSTPNRPCLQESTFKKNIESGALVQEELFFEQGKNLLLDTLKCDRQGLSQLKNQDQLQTFIEDLERKKPLIAQLQKDHAQLITKFQLLNGNINKNPNIINKENEKRKSDLEALNTKIIQIQNEIDLVINSIPLAHIDAIREIIKNSPNFKNTTTLKNGISFALQKADTDLSELQLELKSMKSPLPRSFKESTAQNKTLTTRVAQSMQLTPSNSNLLCNIDRQYGKGALLRDQSIGVASLIAGFGAGGVLTKGVLSLSSKGFKGLSVRFHRFDHPDFMTSDHPKGGGPKGRC